MSETQTQTEPDGDREVKEVIHAQTGRLYEATSDAEGYLLTITRGMERTGLTDEEKKDSALRFMPEEHDGIGDEEGLGVVPARVEAENPQGGRFRKDWRSIRTDKLPDTGNLRCRVKMPPHVLETLGYDPDDCAGELVDIYGGTGVVMFGKPATKTFEVEVPTDLDAAREAIEDAVVV